MLKESFAFKNDCTFAVWVNARFAGKTDLKPDTINLAFTFQEYNSVNY